MDIGLIGAGNIANVIASHAGSAGYKVVCVYDSVEATAKEFSKRHGCKFLKPDKFPRLDLVVEAASQAAAGEYAEQFLDRGINVMVMSVGALVDTALFERLKKAAEKSGAKLILPSGAIAGLDGIRAASIGEIYEVTITTTKSPAGFGGIIDAKGMDKKTVLFEGPASEAVKKFPKNVNVSATLSLAGIGFEKTRVKVVADPAVKGNMHDISVKGEFGEMKIHVDNVPSPDNPKTSYLAAMSAVAAIRKFKESVVIG